MCSCSFFLTSVSNISLKMSVLNRTPEEGRIRCWTLFLEKMAWFIALNAIPHFRGSSFCLIYIGKVFTWERQEIRYMWVILAPTFIAWENIKVGGSCSVKALGWHDKEVLRSYLCISLQGNKGDNTSFLFCLQTE